jgi:iron complex outermembrane receptor protein
MDSVGRTVSLLVVAVQLGGRAVLAAPSGLPAADHGPGVLDATAIGARAVAVSHHGQIVSAPRSAGARAGAHVAPDDGGSIRGQVTDTRTRRPLAGAMVRLEGAKLGAVTNDSGRFVLADVPAGTYRIQVVRIGYAMTTQPVAVADGAALTIDLALTEQPVVIAGVEVVGRQSRGYATDNAVDPLGSGVSVDKLPQSIQIVNQNFIKDLGLTRVDEAYSRFSGVTQVSPYNDPMIRGFRVADKQSEGLAVNGVRGSGLAWTSGSTINVDRVEVLKGPSAILIGDGSYGGVVNVVTKKALANPYYYFETGAGTYGTYRLAADATGPLTANGHLLYRLGASYEHSDTFREVGQRRLLVAPVLTYVMGEHTSLSLEGQYTSYETGWDRGIVAPGNAPLSIIPVTRRYQEPGDHLRSRSWSADAALGHDFSSTASLRVAYRHTHGDDRRIGFENGLLLADDRTLTRDLRRQSNWRNYDQVSATVRYALDVGTVRNAIVTGGSVDLEHRDGEAAHGDEADIDIYYPVYGAPRVISSGLDVDSNGTTRTGLFVQDIISLTPQLTVLLAGRMDHYHQELSSARVPPSPSEASVSQTVRTTQFLPRGGAVYQPIPGLSLYGSYSKSYVPQYLGQTFDGSPLKPEYGTQYETGVRADLLQRRLSTTVALYRITKTNSLASDPLHKGYYTQVGEARSQGVEVDVQGQLSRRWSMIANYTYTDARTTEDPDSMVVGRRSWNVPENAASLWNRYDALSGSWGTLGVGAGVSYVGSRPGDVKGGFTLPDYARVDAALYYARHRMRVAITVENVGDRVYYTGSYSSTQVFPGSPRTVRMTVSFER